MSEIERSIAVLYRRKGKEVLTEKEFVFSASMDLRWFSPKDAQKLMDAGLAGGLLKKVDGNLLPTFDFGRIDVPIDYRPDTRLLRDATVIRTRDLFSEMVDTISRSRSVPKREVVSRVNKKQEKMGIDIEPAVLLVAYDYGLDVGGSYLERATNEVLNRDTQGG
ncbi:MAG: DUF2240 family protein [Methanobacteriota archaeon]|nr:MAG: DUF2240 family protein [Euryarchaeota archaeon]